MSITNIKSLAEYHRIIDESTTLVIVRIFAHWCGACRRSSDAFEKLVKRWIGRVDFYQLNADDARPSDLATIPAHIFARKGKRVGTVCSSDIADLELYVRFNVDG
ncbi:MAG: thioredoxin family protein [Castellaniella sp.]